MPGIPRFLHSRILGFPDSWTPGCTVYRTPKFPHSRIPAFLHSGFQHSWIPGFPSSLLAAQPPRQHPPIWPCRSPTGRGRLRTHVKSSLPRGGAAATVAPSPSYTTTQPHQYTTSPALFCHASPIWVHHLLPRLRYSIFSAPPSRFLSSSPPLRLSLFT